MGICRDFADGFVCLNRSLQYPATNLEMEPLVDGSFCKYQLTGTNYTMINACPGGDFIVMHSCVYIVPGYRRTMHGRHGKNRVDCFQSLNMNCCRTVSAPRELLITRQSSSCPISKTMPRTRDSVCICL